ncbi:Oidioi.mRNA.OKI2018_I69.chr2.g5791.t1.cds [Oikopleura dioica]|uniref:Exocyst complex component 7 n=1 Tax=Oikopleura dioica TaxID=34765 RepID=A0ABN7T5P8_OIKDI|nr:Oidioi.mRNA.OKI2018_I69.chr2.g5791.t1.cds [Oikopleura dioica]
MTEFCAISRRRDIESQIAKDQEKIDAIRNCMLSSREMTTQMSGILESFGSRLEKLEKAVIPVHRQTKDLQRLQENLGKVMNSIENVIGYHNVVKRNQAIINTDPSEHVVRYTTAMTDLLEAEEFFKKSSPDSPELRKVSSLVETGRKKLLVYYEALLKSSATCEDPKFLLTALSSGLSLIDNNEESEKTMDELKKMSEWIFERFGSISEFSDTYARTREQIFAQNISAVKEAAQSSVSKETPAKKNFTIRRATKARKSIGKSKFSRTLSMRSTLNKSFSVSEMGSSPNPKKSAPVDLNVYSTSIAFQAFVRLADREVKVAQEVLPENTVGDVLDKIISNSVFQLNLTADKLLAELNRCDNEEFGAFIELCPLLQVLQKIQSQATSALQFASDENRRFIPQVLRNMESAAADVLQRYQEMVQQDKPKNNLPDDATVHNLISDALYFLNSLEEYSELVNQIFTHTGKRQGGFSDYMVGIIGAIALATQTKSFQYPDETRKKLFFLNNQHYICKKLTSSKLSKHIESTHDDFVNNQLAVEEEKRRDEFLDLWVEIKRKIDLSEIKMSTSKVSGGEKQKLKELFRDFNSKFTELSSTCKTLTVPDEALRNDLKDEISRLLTSSYTELWEAGQKKSDFTSKPTKYFVFTPAQVQEEISALFDPSN